MAAKGVLAVVGATGAQGGALARAILADPERPFDLRALTRNPTSPAAEALRQRGAEVVACDLDDPASVARALQGAYGAFCLTNFWEHFSPEKEAAQAATMARASRSAGLAHVIWSTLEDTRERVPLADARMPTLGGRYKVPHFDAKGAADDTFRREGAPTTCLRTSFYWENLIHFGMGPKADGAGGLVFSLPLGRARLPGIAVEDIGRCAYAVFKDPGRWIGKTLGVAGEHPTGAEMAAALAAALGRPVRYEPVAFEAYRALGFPGADDLGNIFQYKHDFEAEFCAARDLRVARALCPSLQDFRTWLAENAPRIPLG